MNVDAVLITGPTASGKSAAALALAEAIGGTIINADSMQVYRELRILTARPSDADMARVPHLLFGHVGVRERYSAGRYRSDAAAALAEALSEGRMPIFVGGTGLYFGVLTEGIADIPRVPEAIHEAARKKLLIEGSEKLHAALKLRDPETAGQLSPSDGQRILRAYGVIEATGRSLADWQREGARPVVEGRLARFVLNPPRAVLHPRIAARYEAMVAEGVLEEVRALAWLDPTLPAAKVLGLREIVDFQEGGLDQVRLAEVVIAGTRQYAKRQSTWFRNKMADWHWISALDRSNIVAEILSKIA